MVTTLKMVLLIVDNGDVCKRKGIRQQVYQQRIGMSLTKEHLKLRRQKEKLCRRR